MHSSKATMEISMNNRSSRLVGALAAIVLALALVGCDIVDQGTQTDTHAADTQAQQLSETQAQTPQAASRPPLASAVPPSARASASAAAGVGNQAAFTQAPAQQDGALAEYESIVNQVYENTVRSVV